MKIETSKLGSNQVVILKRDGANIKVFRIHQAMKLGNVLKEIASYLEITPEELLASNYEVTIYK